MRKIKDTTWVAIYNIILIAMFTVLVYFIREWWLLFMLLGLASNPDKEDVENEEKK